MKLGFARFTASSNKNKRLAIVFIILSGLLITMFAAYGISGQRRVQGPRTSTQNPNRRGRAIRAKTSSTRKGVQGCFPPPSGLVSWYRGEGDAKDFETTNQGAANGALAFVPGKVGQAFKFDGTNGVDIPDSASLRPSALTIDGWIRPNFAGRPRFTADFDTIFEKMDANHDGYFLGVTQDPTFAFGLGGPFPNGTIAFQVNIGGTRQAVYSNSVIPNDSQFHHVAATYDGAFLRVYLDGNPVGQQTVGNAIVHSTGPAHIGLSTSSGVKNSLAAIDEVDLYNRALTDAEIGSIFAADGSGKCTVNQNPIYFENFEAGNGGYTSTIATGPFGWNITASCEASLAGHSLSNAFRFGNPDVCDDYGIGVRDAATLMSVPIDLTNASGTLVLDFRYLLKTDDASPTAATDKARVDLYEPGGVGLSFVRTAASNRQNPVSPILSLQDAGPAGSAQWNDLQIDVSDFAHKKLVVAFFFDTMDAANNNQSGWLIDDVQVRSDSDLNGGGTELLHENFERGLDGFVNADSDDGDQWQATTNCGGADAGGHSQSTIVRMGRSSTCDYDTGGPPANATLTSPDIDLTGAAAQAVLSFNYYLSTESNAPDLNADIARVRISTDNFATSQILATNRTDLASDAELLFDAADSALPRNFSRSIIDISGFIGNHVKIRWDFDTVDGLNNAFPGWAIDDVVIRAGVNAPTPVISGVNPSGGSPFGGTQVTIAGSGFAAAGTPNPPLVFFGNNQATTVIVNSDNQLTCFTPAGTGAVKVTVITANGQTREDVFYTYFSPPEVDSVSPTFGVTTGGTHVTVSGLNFDPSGAGPGGSGGTNVIFAESPGTNVVVVNDNTITVDSPAGTGIVDVVVNNGNGVSNTGVKFQYFPVIVTSISPTVGPEAGGTNFTVSGFGDPNANTTGVTFGGKPATNIVVGPSTITGKTPSGTGQVPVVVQSSMGDSNANILFTYQPQPLANQVTAVMTTYLAGNLGIVLPNPDVNLPTPTQTVINGLPAGAHPYGAAFATSDHVLISDFGASRIFVVQISNNSVISTIDTSPDYDGRGTIAVSPNRTFALFASGPTLYVKPTPVDTAGPHTTVTLPGNVEDFRKQAIAFDFNGRAFVYNSTGISVLDAPYTSVAFTIPFANSGGGIAINSSANRLLVTDFTDTVKIFNAPFSTASVPTMVIFPGGPHLSGVAISPDSSAALVSEFHTPRLFTMVQPFNPSPQILEDVLPPGLASSPTGFSDLSMSADGQFAIGTGNDAADTAQPAAFIEAPFNNPRIFAVNITGPGRGDGVARFLPPGLAPGLTITKSAPSTVPSGSNMTYTLSYANTGAIVIPDVQIKDTVPSGTTFVSAANGGANNFGTVAWSVGDVAPNTSGTVSFIVNVTAAQGATIINSNYSAQGDVGSVVAGSPVSTAVTATASGPDLSIQKTHTGNFTVGIDGFYTINVTNVGSSTTTGSITVTDVLPAGLTFVSNTGSGTCSAVSQTVTCQMTTPLTANQSESVTLRVGVASAASPSVVNTATVSTAGDVNSANDSSSDTTTVNKSAELALSFSVSSNSVQAGTNVTYTIGVTNNGPSPATGVTVTSPLPSNVTFVSGNFSQGSCSANTTLVTCTIGNMASGATVTGTIVVKPTSGSSFQAVVNLSGNEPDPNTGNNGASTTIGVTPPPPPIVSSINPTTGAEAGGTSVTITGSNFSTFNAGTTSVTFGGSLATSVVVVSDTSITCATPAGKGQVPVVVSNNNGTSNATVIFTYQLSPLANANPAILTTVGIGNLAIVFPRPDLNLPTPTQNNVTGTANGVQPQGVAYFGSDSALVSDAGNSRIFVVKISTAAVLDTISTAGKFDGSGTIAVAPSLNFALGSGSTTSLAVVKAPFNSSSVVNTVPLPGAISGFQTQAIVFDATGRAFVYTTAGISVLDAPYTSVAFTIPVSNANSGAMAITPNGQTLLATSFSNGVSIFSAPFSSGSVATSLPISGATSLDGIAVTPDGNTALVADRSTPKVFAIAAPFAGGSAVQSLPMPPGIGTAGFEDIGISADGQLAIAAGGDSSDSPALFIGAPFTSAGARTFAVNVNGGGRGAGAVRFLPPGLAPGLTISKTGPATVATNANLNYTINFANTGQTNATNVIVKDPIPAGATFVSASNGGTLVNGVATWNLGNVPAGTGGTLTLTVSTALTSGTINNVNYTIEGTGFSPIPGPPVATAIVNNQPIVRSITPNVGAATGNTAVVISGQNFKAVGAGTNTVKFGTASATSISVVDDQTITAVSPAGTGTVSVTVVNGNGTSNSDVTFTYTTSQLFLQVSEISPAQAPENGGTPVKITGIGFGSGNSSGTAVLIGGKPASNVIVVNDTEVDAVVPAGTGVVNVSVSNSLGSSTLVGGFTYVKPLPQNIEIDWHAPSDPTQQLAPPRDTSSKFTTNSPANGGGGISQQISAQAVPSADATTFVIAYNVFRGFTPDFAVNSSQGGGAENVTQALGAGVTQIATIPANQLTMIDTAAALAAAQANGFGTPFYKVTAVYQTPTGIQSSQASIVAAPLPLITAVSIVNSGTGKIIRIDGVGFASFRAILEINGTQFTTLAFPPAQRLENGTAGRIELQDNTGNLIPVGAQVTITVLNPGLTPGSGTRSSAFIFRRLN